MALLDIFRSKLKNSDPSIRSEAVRRIPAEDAALLARILREDGDVGVRRIALKKLKDPDLLADIGKTDGDEGLRKQAAEKATGIWVALANGEDQTTAVAALGKLSEQTALGSVASQAQLVDVRTAALARLEDDRALAEVAKSAAEPADRLTAIAKIDSVNVLRGIAQNANFDDVALAATDKLDDPEALDSIARKARRKAAKRRASERLAASGAQRPTSSKQRRGAQRELVAAAEALASSHDFAAAGNELELLRDTWKDLGADADPELQGRFEQAQESFYQRRERYASKRAAATPDAAASTDAADAADAADATPRTRAQVCADLERLVARGLRPNLVAQVASKQKAWDELGAADDDGNVELDARFSAALAAAEELLAAGRRGGDERRSDAEALLTRAEGLLTQKNAGKAMAALDGIQKDWARLAAGVVLPAELGERLERVRGRLVEKRERHGVRETERKNENLAKLEALCAEVDGLVGKKTSNLRTTLSALSRSQNWLKNPKPLPADAKRDAYMQRLNDGVTKLHVRAQELRESEEWQQWSNEPVREQLCTEVEALLTEPDLRKVAKSMRELDKKWREAGPVARDKHGALRDRFRKASTQLRKKLDKYFKQQDSERKDNLVKKIALCEQAEALQDSTQWRTTADELKRLQAEWKSLGPTPKSDGDKTWKRFRTACDKFFDRRKEDLGKLDAERGGNLTKKVALAEKAEALKDSTDWETTADELKRLQAEWKKIGPAPRAKADAIWNRFRGACDRFFERFSKKDEIELEQNLEQLDELAIRVEGIAAEAEQVAEGDDDARRDVLDRTKDALNQRRNIGHTKIGRESDLAHERFDQAVARVVDKFPDSFQGTELDPALNVQRRTALVERIEALAAQLEEERATGSSVADMAAQLQKALVDNALRDRGSEDERRALSNEHDEIRSAWKRTRPTADDAGKELEERFKAAARLFKDRLTKLGKS